MVRLLIVLTIFSGLFLWIDSSHAQVHGIDVQVNEGQDVPTADQLRTLINPGDFVRDMLGWSHVDPNCDLAGNPRTSIDIPDAMAQLYQRVASVGGRNFISLGFNNTACGQSSNLGNVTFPNTPALRAEFAAYAVQVVKSVPALGGISIWNELNGAYKGGFGTKLAPKLQAYCLLANQVIAEVRKVAPTLPIAIGATVGWNIQGYFIHMFDAYGCIGKNDPFLWLDVHPYLTGKLSPAGVPDWTLWRQQIGNIREDGIGNSLIATEWGGPAAVKWAGNHTGGNYIAAFETEVVAGDPSWAALTWFEGVADANFPKSGLYDAKGKLTTNGRNYISQFGQLALQP